MRFTFQEEKNRDSRDSNHNTLAPEKHEKTAQIWRDPDGTGSNKDHASEAEQMAHKEPFA